MKDSSSIKARPEQEIFEELGALCISPGYAHAISMLCFRDIVIGIGEELTASDLENLHSGSRLIKTEISTLIGLLVKQSIDLAHPGSEAIQIYLDKTEGLLGELHISMINEWSKDFDPKNISDEKYNPFTSGTSLREPIFYGGESAYSFQYRDLANAKYSHDQSWLEKNKGFSIQTAQQVASAILNFMNENQMSALVSLRSLPPDAWTMLPGFSFTNREIADQCGLEATIVENVLTAFTLPSDASNPEFNSLSDFNTTNATPLLKQSNGKYILFQYYSFVESLYESPFFWMVTDPAYKSEALLHRGRFTESVSKEFLERVFSDTHIFINVDIYKKKTEKLGEIDVLVIFADRIIVLQAKSKRLTIEARKGNDLQIKDDFKKAVQDAYDQAYSCAIALLDPTTKLVTSDGKEIELNIPPKKIYPLCIVSDHYPALNFQSRQFLTIQENDKIEPPIVTDVFALDVMTEMLQSPLRFLSYLSLRAKHSEMVMAMHEITLLGYHLKRNLWETGEYDLVMIDDEVSIDLDVAMTVRRDGLPGVRTPEGILTRMKDTAVGRMIEEIEAQPEPGTLDLGLLLLELSEDTVKDVSQYIDQITAQTMADGKTHDVTISIGGGSTGLTVHCTRLPDAMAASALGSYCERRKYREKADCWFGVVIRPEDGSLRLGCKFEAPWKFDKEMNRRVRNMSSGYPNAKLSTQPAKKRKIGRNETCPCGSGKKYKKCCLINPEH